VWKTVLSLGDKLTVEVSESWMRENAPSALDNPVSRARLSGKPTLAVFSGASCCGPDKAQPIADSVRKKYGEKINVVYVEARTSQVLTARHRVEAIPTFILYDGKGKETPRHDGLLTLDEIAAMLRQVGIE
jgi:thiol-disulfide isomerase/thioredoxin